MCLLDCFMAHCDRVTINKLNCSVDYVPEVFVSGETIRLIFQFFSSAHLLIEFDHKTLTIHGFIYQSI